MAAKKKTETVNVPVPTFTKEQIVHSRKYERFQDYLQGNLEDNKLYSIKDIDTLVDKLQKGKVK